MGQEHFELHMVKKLGCTSDIGSADTWVLCSHRTPCVLLITAAHSFHAEQRQYGTWTRFTMETGQNVILSGGSTSDFQGSLNQASQLRSSTYSQIRLAQNTEFLLIHAEVQHWGQLNALCFHCNNSPYFTELQPSGAKVGRNFIHTQNKYAFFPYQLGELQIYSLHLNLWILVPHQCSWTNLKAAQHKYFLHQRKGDVCFKVLVTWAVCVPVVRSHPNAIIWE